MMRALQSIVRHPSVRWYIAAVLWCVFSPLTPAMASPLSEKAKESKCVNKPVPKGGELYTCSTEGGVVTYFNVPGANEAPGQERSSKRNTSAPAPAGFPRVDGETQKIRDDMRKKVLSDELATEQKLLAEARTAYADGAPAPLPEERADAEKYRARIGKLRQTLSVHEKNVEALKKELSLVK